MMAGTLWLLYNQRGPVTKFTDLKILKNPSFCQFSLAPGNLSQFQSRYQLSILHILTICCVHVQKKVRNLTG